jgi:hypothetical protein
MAINEAWLQRSHVTAYVSLLELKDFYRGDFLPQRGTVFIANDKKYFSPPAEPREKKLIRRHYCLTGNVYVAPAGANATY